MRIRNLNTETENFGTVCKNKKAIAEYIANQLKEDREIEQMAMQKLVDPFKK